MSKLHVGDFYFGGLVHLGCFLTKLVIFILFFILVRWTVPRFRYDQLMDLAWKSLIPLALINLVATATIVQLIRG